MTTSPTQPDPRATQASSTPETDAEDARLNTLWESWPRRHEGWLKHARTLERQRNEAIRKLEETHPLETCQSCEVPMCPSQIEAGNCFKCIAERFAIQRDEARQALAEADIALRACMDYILATPVSSSQLDLEVTALEAGHRVLSKIQRLLKP